jgi:alkylation response protein AidB-like acyl-CoA dehydrogenase
VAEELAFGDLSLALAALSPLLMMIPILEFGTDEQKRHWLPKFCGERFFPATAAFMEPRVTFDPFALTTTARECGDKVLLTGAKCMVPLADRAQEMLVYAVGGGGEVEAYIVDRDTPGVQVGACEKNLGLRALPLFPVTFEECVVPVERRVGGGRGIDSRRLLNLSRATLGAMAVGVSRASLEYALDYAKERTAFGDPIASRQSIAFMLAEAAMEIDAMRLLTWRTAWRLDRGDEATRDASLARMYCADQSMKVVDYGVQILGGHGYIREHPVEMWFRNGRAFAVLDGVAIM